MSASDEKLTTFEVFPQDLPSDLELPGCSWNEDETLCTRTIEQENVLLKIYLGYTLAMKHRPRIENILEFDSTIFKINQDALAIAVDSMEDQKDYMQHLVRQNKKKNQEIQDAERQGKIKSLWIGLGTGAVGVIVGFILGWQIM